MHCPTHWSLVQSWVGEQQALPPQTLAVGQQAPPMQVEPPSQVPVGLDELHTGALQVPSLQAIPDGQQVEPQARSLAQQVPPVQVVPLAQKPFGFDAEHGVTQRLSMQVWEELQQRLLPHTRALWQHEPSTQLDPDAQVPLGLLALHSVEPQRQSPKPDPSDMQVCVPLPPPEQVQLFESPGVHPASSVPEQPATSAVRTRQRDAARMARA
jgi:hypothetical protein